MGLSISNVAATAVANRLITKADTAGQATLQATGVATGTSTTAGSYTQITASSSAEYLVTGINVHGTNSTSSATLLPGLPVLLDIATGGAGSESVKATVPLSSVQYAGANASLSATVNLAVPLRISSGTRLAVRATKSALGDGNAITSLVVTLVVVTYTNVEGN